MDIYNSFYLMVKFNMIDILATYSRVYTLQTTSELKLLAAIYITLSLTLMQLNAFAKKVDLGRHLK